MNQVRGLLGEFGIVVPQGVVQIRKALPCILEDAENGLTDLSREIFSDCQEQLIALTTRIDEQDEPLPTV